MVCQALVPPAIYDSDDPTTVEYSTNPYFWRLLFWSMTPPPSPTVNTKKQPNSMNNHTFTSSKKGRQESNIQYLFNLPGPEERRGDRVGGQRHDEAGSFLRRIHKPWCKCTLKSLYYPQQNWPKWTMIGQNFVFFFMLKSTPSKKSTTAGGRGGDKYQLCDH